MFEDIMGMPDSPERTEKYKKMTEYITAQLPWIFESYPIGYKLVHSWVENYVPHNFVFSNWKYLSVDVEARRKARKSFKPIELRDLR